MQKMQLIETSLQQNKGFLSESGALMVSTGASTGRSTKERYVVQHPEVEKDIEWGSVNQPMSVEKAEQFFTALKNEIQTQKNYQMEGYVGCFGVKVTSLSPWHIAFAENMFRDTYVESLKAQIPDDINIEIWHAPEASMSELGLEAEYEKAIILDPHNLRVGIVGTAYAGEIKKSAFTLCNFLLPKYDIMPMHSSANCLVDGENSSILFGLSGTGKTTLSADPSRALIGDDEIIWSHQGLSNLEGGCYAKLINLDKNNEPDIFKAANSFGSILENVAFSESTREIDFDNNQHTENTRGSYKIHCLENVFNQNVEAKPPKSIVFLTADAFGALPAVAKLDPWQAQFHFISGYTAKVAGTEIGVVEPEATFSACFGAPFMPRPASVYGALLSRLCEKYDVPVYILNTGWVNGFENGERFPISVSRQLLTAIQSGSLAKVDMKRHPVFGFEVPVAVPGVDSKWLSIPEGPQVEALAQKFMKNAFSKPGSFTAEIINKGGPVSIN